MYDFHDGQFNADPLGSEFTAADRDLDSLLAEVLQDVNTPAGLAERVFAASSRLLPAVSDAPALRLVGTNRDRIVVRRRMISRIAMAASVALAGAIGLKVCLPTANATSVVANDADWSVFEELDSSYVSVSQLFATDGMTLDEVTGELTILVRAGESGM